MAGQFSSSGSPLLSVRDVSVRFGGIVALGYAATGGARVDEAWLSARFEIDIAGERVPVRARLKAPYDPANAKLKG